MATLLAEVRSDGRSVQPLDPDARPRALAEGHAPLEPGALVGVEPDGAAARLVEGPLAAPGTARHALVRIAHEAGCSLFFPRAALDEVARWERAPGLEDGTLEDLTALPFVTIDGPTSRDLDQALYLEPDPAGGTELHYALADAAHFVPRTSALFAEALARGASTYLPGFSVPMLPRALSEGLCSLNPEVPRRALVFSVRLDRSGHLRDSRVRRARIVSRRKLAFGEVQSLYDAPSASALSRAPFARSLALLREVGEQRIELAAAEGHVRHRREEVDLGLSHGGLVVTATRASRDAVERYNEQLSLLVNAEGARLLAAHPSPTLEPIYRVHPAPSPAQLEALRATVDALTAAHALPDVPFRWHRGRALSAYLAALPEVGPHARVARAIERQALLVNVRSTYATEPGPHHGVGVNPYGRFTAPMREVVGVFLHAETLEAFFPESGEAPAIHAALRDEVVRAANRAKDVQRRVTDLATRLALDRLFGDDLARPESERPLRVGTVMGLARGKVHVTLDEPPLDLKLYLRELGRALGGVWLEVASDGITLVSRHDQRAVLRVGDAVSLRVVALDRETDRWILRPMPHMHEPR